MTEELSKGFTGIEINGVRFSNIKEMLSYMNKQRVRIIDLEKENAELRKVAEFQQSSNMSRYFENKKLKEGLAVGSIFNKALNSMNKSLEEERDKYRNMVFDKIAQLDQAKEIINELLMNSYDENTREKALNFLYPDKKEE